MKVVGPIQTSPRSREMHRRRRTSQVSTGAKSARRSGGTARKQPAAATKAGALGKCA
jgi:hypothetical protein